MSTRQNGKSNTCTQRVCTREYVAVPDEYSWIANTFASCEYSSREEPVPRLRRWRCYVAPLCGTFLHSHFVQHRSRSHSLNVAAAAAGFYDAIYEPVECIIYLKVSFRYKIKGT